jgi:ABC-type sugar transport system ATPase subunit
VSAPILRALAMQKRYGGVHALRGVHLDVYPGEVHALVGENGSGKSTLLKILSGQLQPDDGEIVLDGRPTSFRSAADALRQGIAAVTQETTLAPDLSVAENVLLGRRMPRRAHLIDWRGTRTRAVEALARLDLDLDPSVPVRRLRPDQQQMVEIARALAHEARIVRSRRTPASSSSTSRRARSPTTKSSRSSRSSAGCATSASPPSSSHTGSTRSSRSRIG